SGLGWPTAPPLHGSALITLQPLLERLITHHPVRAPDRLLLRILLHQKLTPAPLAAAVVFAPFQVVRVFRQQGVGGPRSVRPATRPGILPRFRHQPGLQGVALDVATATQEISLALDGRTLETTLPEVAHEAIAPIEVVDVGAQHTRLSGDTNSDPLPPVLIPTPIMPSCYRLSTPLSGSFLVFTSVSRWVCSGSTFVNLDR